MPNVDISCYANVGKLDVRCSGVDLDKEEAIEEFHGQGQGGKDGQLACFKYLNQVE